jgi:DNA-binding SARP family transcriptional activator
MEFRVLGPLEVVEQGEPLALGGERQRALLGLLLLHANETVPRERLIDGLWGDGPPDTAGNALQVAVHGLRRLLGAERVATQPSGYALRVGPEELDALRFESLLEQARGSTAAVAAETLREALALWRGTAFGGLGDRPFARTEAARLEELRLGALEERIEQELALGRHERLVAELERVVAAHPFRERRGDS